MILPGEGSAAGRYVGREVWRIIAHRTIIASGLYRVSQAVVESATRHLELTAVYRKVPVGYIGFIEELPGANTQGRTLEEARANLRDATELVLEANRDLATQSTDDAGVIREPLRIGVE